LVIIEVIQRDAVQLPASHLGHLLPVNARGALEEKSGINEHSRQRRAAVPQKRKAPGFGKL